MPLKNSAIIIITYNTSALIAKQLDLVKKYCEDEHDVIVVDNSDAPEAIDAIRYHASLRDCVYVKTQSSSRGGSDSHSFAANFAYGMFKDDYDYFFFLDHDCFPVRPFSIQKELHGKMMAGIGQEKKELYFWPGCLMFKKEVQDIDFSPLPGLDTGGSLYRTMKSLGKNNLIFFNEVHVENPGFKKTMYNFYSLINHRMFMHFINGSNWNNKGHHQERLNSLFNILDQLCE